MLLSMSEIAMADDHEHVGCLVDWTPLSFTRGGQKLRDDGQAFTPLPKGVYIINGKKEIVR